MSKSIFNLFLILIICSSAMSMPMDFKLKTFSLKLPSIRLPQFEKESSSSVTYTLDINSSSLENPSSIDLQIHTEDETILSMKKQDYGFMLDIIKNDTILSTIDGTSLLNEDSTVTDHKKTLTLSLSKDDLNLSDGDYTVKLYSKSDALKNIAPININVKYFTLSKYIPAVNYVPENRMNVTLYFPDSIHNKYLVPITRFVTHNRTPLSTTLKNLKVGSAAFNFTSPIPNISKLRVKKGVATVYLSSYSLDQSIKDPTTAAFALDSLVHSLTSVVGVNSVKFLVDGKESDDLFYGHTTKTLFTKDDHTNVYLGLDFNKERLLLVPKPLENVHEDTLIPDILDELKRKVQDSELTPTVPKNVELLSFSRNGTILTLNFNDKLLYAYKDRLDLQRFMLDSILYSFSSIPEVEKIQILIHNKSIDSLAEIDLSGPITKPLCINPEKE